MEHTVKQRRESYGGLAAWLLAKWQSRSVAKPRLALVERISLGSRQFLALVEAEGRRILVASSDEGGPAFYPIDEVRASRDSARTQPSLSRRSRVSW